MNFSIIPGISWFYVERFWQKDLLRAAKDLQIIW